MTQTLLKTIAVAVCLIGASAAVAQPGFGPSRVQVAPAIEGTLAPQTEFRGTIFFRAVSEVATETNGKVVEVLYEVGGEVAKGDPLVVLDDTLLQKEIASTRATRQRYQTELEDAEVRFERAQRLLSDGIATPEQTDELRFRVESLRHQTASVTAELERMQALVERNTIRSPFDGIIIARSVELGEWTSAGDAVATVALRGSYEAIAEVPEQYIQFVEPGMSATVSLADGDLVGEVATIVPRGDIATRSFSVKVRIDHPKPLLEGMTAMVRLPTAEPIACVLIPRDGILQLRDGKQAYTVSGDQAVQHSIRVLGYQGKYAGVNHNGIRAGDQVLVKGHERLRDGAQIEIVNETASAQTGS